MTPREFEVLELLVRNQGMVLNAAQIYERVWKEQAFQSDNTVMVHIRKIREKIEAIPRKPRYIKQYGELATRLRKIFEPIIWMNQVLKNDR